MSINRIKVFARWGIVYWSPSIYRLTMALLRGRGGREEMYKKVAREIGNRSLLELCCGTGDLIPYVPGRYQGIDCNPTFARALQRQGLPVFSGDVLSVDWPETEALVMIDSLYHFVDRFDILMKRIREHPAHTVVISEPVVNVLPRLKGKLQGIATWMTRVEGQSHPHRFTEETLQAFFRLQGFQKVDRVGTNLIGVWDKRG